MNRHIPIILVGKVKEDIIHKLLSEGIKVVGLLSNVIETYMFVESEDNAKTAVKVVVLPFAWRQDQHVGLAVSELKQIIEKYPHMEVVCLFSKDNQSLYKQVKSAVDGAPIKIVEVEKLTIPALIDSAKSVTTASKMNIFSSVTPPVGKINTSNVNVLSRKDSKTIAIFSLVEGAGSSFITINVANRLSKEGVSVNVFEACWNKPYLHRFLPETSQPDWRSPITQLYSGISQSNLVKRDNVVFVVLSEQDEPNFDPRVNIKLLAQTRTEPLVLIDGGHNWDNPVVREIFEVCDEVWMVLSPDFKNIRENFELWKRVQPSTSVKYIVNKMDSYFMSVLNKVIELPTNSIIGFVPVFNQSLISKSEFTTTIFTDMPETDVVAKAPFDELLRRLR